MFNVYWVFVTITIPNYKLYDEKYILYEFSISFDPLKLTEVIQKK